MFGYLHKTVEVFLYILYKGAMDMFYESAAECVKKKTTTTGCGLFILLFNEWNNYINFHWGKFNSVKVLQVKITIWEFYFQFS